MIPTLLMFTMHTIIKKTQISRVMLTRVDGIHGIFGLILNRSRFDRQTQPLLCIWSKERIEIETDPQVLYFCVTSLLVPFPGSLLRSYSVMKLHDEKKLNLFDVANIWHGFFCANWHNMTYLIKNISMKVFGLFPILIIRLVLNLIPSLLSDYS